MEGGGFTHRYNSVKRFVRTLKVREPERFDVLESLPAEECQVDFGQGALTRYTNGKYRRPYLFVMSEPQLNPVYAALLAHYSSVADPVAK